MKGSGSGVRTRAAASIAAAAFLWGLIGLLCSMLPYILYTRGLAHVAPGRAAVLATLEPAVATAAGVLVFREPLTAEKLAGVACIIGAVALREPGRSEPDVQENRKAH